LNPISVASTHRNALQQTASTLHEHCIHTCAQDRVHGIGVQKERCVSYFPRLQHTATRCKRLHAHCMRTAYTHMHRLHGRGVENERFESHFSRCNTLQRAATLHAYYTACALHPHMHTGYIVGELKKSELNPIFLAATHRNLLQLTASTLHLHCIHTSTQALL